jgi:hypothetical protein
MEWILGILVLVLGATAVIVIYLSERINVFETLLGLNPKVTTDKLAEHVTYGPNPFGDLNGENLWKAMIGEKIEDPEIEVGDLDKVKPRYEMVLSRHIETLIEDGRFDGRAGERSQPKSTMRISMLRGSVESYMPYVEASRLYEIGQEIETKPEKADTLAREVDEIVDDLFVQVGFERSRSFGRALLPQIEDDDENFDDLPDPEPDTPERDDTLALPPGEEKTDADETR